MPSRGPKKPALTHFLCLKLVSPVSRPQLASSLAAFKADVTEPKPGKSVPESDSGSASGPKPDIPTDAIRPLGALHLTLGMMSFPKDKTTSGDAEGERGRAGEEEQGLAKAIEILRGLKPRDMLAGVEQRRLLQEASLGAGETTAERAGPSAQSATEPAGEATHRMPAPSVDTEMAPTATTSQPQAPSATTQSHPLTLTLRGLRTMQKPSQASMLYAPPEDPRGVLQAFCEDLRAAFLGADVMVKEDRPLLLHATVANTVYAKGGGRGRGKGNGRGKGRLTFDARELLKRYEGYTWMEDVPLEKIAICRMGAKAVEGGDGAAYEVEAEIDF